MQHTRRQHRCVARTPPGTARAQSGCQRCQPCMMLPALHLHCQPCGCWQGLPHAGLPVQMPNSAFRNLLLPLLQELVSFPITLDDEGLDDSGDLEADDATLPDQQPAALTGSEERQPVPMDEPAPNDKAAEQVRQLPPAQLPRRAASLHLRCSF